MKLIQRVTIAHYLFVLYLNCSIISFSVCLVSPTYDRERIFRKTLPKLEKWPLCLQPFSTSHENWFEHTAKLQSNDVSHLIVFAANVSMPCVHIRYLKSYINRKLSTYFSLGRMNEGNFKIS